MALTIDDIKALLSEKAETPNKDFKGEFVWSRNNKDLCLEVVKDIMAMANTEDGGKIVFGVNDKNYDHVGLSEKTYHSFDSTPINELLHKYAEPPFSCNVVKNIVNGKRTVVIDVPEFREIPIVCKKSTNSKDNKELLRKGAVYIRTKKSTSEQISNADEMRRILGIGVAKKGEEIFEVVQKIIKGAPPAKKSIQNDKKKFETEIKESLKFFDKNLVNENNWGKQELIMHPLKYNKNLIKNPLEAGELVKSNKIRLRGWDFPHIDSHGNFTNFNNGKQSITISDRVPHREAWRMYKSGLFAWSEVLGEDLMDFSEDNQKVLYFVSKLYSITEFTLFMKRLYAETLSVDTLDFKLSVYGTLNRRLGSGQSGLLSCGYICKEDSIIIEKQIQTVDLLSSFKDVAKEIIKDLFMMFNWNDPLDSMLEDWQNKLIERGG